MKRTLFTIIALLLAGYTFAQTDTSGRSLYRATPEKKTALKHTKSTTKPSAEKNGSPLPLIFMLPIALYSMLKQ